MKSSIYVICDIFAQAQKLYKANSQICSMFTIQRNLVNQRQRIVTRAQQHHVYKLCQLNNLIKDAIHVSKHICQSEIHDKQLVMEVVVDLEKIKDKLHKQIQSANNSDSNAWDVIV